MLKKGILLIGTGILVIGALTVYSVEVKGKEQIRDNGNYTINKVLSSYEGEEFFTTDYVDEMGVLMKILKSSLMRKVVYFIL